MGGNGKKTLVIRNGVLIDGSGSPPQENDALVIEGNHIRSVGPIQADLQLEDRDDVQVIDAAGQWVMPGLIDSHVHLSFGRPDYAGVPVAKGTTSAEFSAIRAAMNAQNVLRAGVTSISVPGGAWFVDVAVRGAINAGLVEGPRIFCAGRILSVWGGGGDKEPSWTGTPDHATGILCNGPEAMALEVRRQCKHGVNLIKLIDSDWGTVQAISREELSAAVEEAHRRNARVTIHARGSKSVRNAIDCGVDWIMHADMATDADLDAAAEAGVRILPTFTSAIAAMQRPGGFGFYDNEEELLKRHMDAGVRVAEKAHKLGIPVMSGSDTGNCSWMTYGDYHGHEAEIFVKDVGLSPMEAIVANTSGNAFAVGLEDEVGVIEAGKLADVIILKADPLADIRVLKDKKNLSAVIKDGNMVDLDPSNTAGESLRFEQVAA